MSAAPAGGFDRPMQLERPLRTELGDGGAAVSFEPVAMVWAALARARLSERIVAGRTDSLATHRARIRARGDIAGGWRLTEGPRVFRVLAVDDAERRAGVLTLLLEEEGQ